MEKCVLVENINTKNLYAAKISFKQCIKKQDQAFFFNEIETLMNANNPAILKIIGFSLYNFSSEPYPTIILEYLPNGSLSDILEKTSHGIAPHEWDDTKKYINLLGIAFGMKYLHFQKTVQRDLKPSNILLDKNFYPRICDFGLSKQLNELDSTNLMKTGIGTLLYMAPEILTGDPYTYKIDVYAYAILAYEVITSESPIPKGENPMKYIHNVPNGKRPDLTKITCKEQVKLLEMCWSNDPKERPTFAQVVDIIKDEKFFSGFEIDEDEVNEYIDLFPGESHIAKSRPTAAQTVTTTPAPLVTKTAQPSTAQSSTSTPAPLVAKTAQPSSSTPTPEITSDDVLFRISLVGNSSTHKYDIISIFISGDFGKNIPATIGAGIFDKTVRTEYGCCTLQIWDTVSNEIFHGLAPMYLRNAKAVLICCNLNVKDQLDSLKFWLNCAESDSKPGTLIYIAAVDCLEGCTFDLDKIESFANEHGIVLFNVALNSKLSIDSMFIRIANDIMKIRKNLSSPLNTNTYYNKYNDDNNKKSCLIYYNFKIPFNLLTPFII